MRPLKLSAFLTLFVSVVVVSCQKDVNGDENEKPAPAGKLVRIHQGQDPLTDDDSVYLITYNEAGKMHQLIDSMYEDTLTATYNAAGKIERITKTSGVDAIYKYDDNGLLIQQDFVLGYHDRYVFTYNNGVIEKKSHYINEVMGGPLSLWRYYTYTVTGDNITNIKEYDKNGTQVSELVLTYSTLPNDYKDLALFNYGNYLGLSPFLSEEAFFNKNVVSTITGDGLEYTLTSTTGANQQLSKLVSHEDTYGYTFTWRFNYK